MGQLKTYGDVLKFDLRGGNKDLKCTYEYKEYTFNEIYNVIVSNIVNCVNMLIDSQNTSNEACVGNSTIFLNIINDMKYFYNHMYGIVIDKNRRRKLDEEVSVLNNELIQKNTEQLQQIIDNQALQIENLNKLCTDLSNQCEKYKKESTALNAPIPEEMNNQNNVTVAKGRDSIPFVTLHYYDFMNTYSCDRNTIRFYSSEISAFKENPENLIKEHSELKNVSINTGNIEYITDFTVTFKVQNYPDTFYKEFSTIHLNSGNYIDVAETQEEILEIINNADRSVSGNHNLLQKS